MSIEPGISTPNTSAPPSTEALLYQYLQYHDAPCPVCGYNLRQLERDICPECGQQFRLSIGATHPRFAAFLLFLMPPIMLGGLALLLTAMAAWALAFGRTISDAPWQIWTIMVLGAADLGGVLLLYRWRTWFLRRSPANRAVLAFLSWLVHIGGVTVLLTTMS